MNLATYTNFKTVINLQNYLEIKNIQMVQNSINFVEQIVTRISQVEKLINLKQVTF